METVIEQVTAIDDDDTVNAILVRREERACSSGFDAKAAAGREMKSVTDWEQQLKLQFDFIMQFTEPIVSARGFTSSRNFIMFSLCGIVTFIPSN